MSLDFTKNVANYLTYGVASFNPLINGAARVIVSARVEGDTYSAANNDDNKILQIWINGSSTGINLNIYGVGGASRVRVGSRSIATDATQQSLIGPTNIGTVLAHVGCDVNFAGDALAVYVNGVQDATSGVSFGSATYSPGSPSLQDAIGGDGAPPSSNTFQFDGRIADLAIWAFASTDEPLTADEWLALSRGFSPLMIRPAKLVFHEPFFSRTTLIPDKVHGLIGTITGTLNYADHASTVLRRSDQVYIHTTQTIPLAFSTTVVKTAGVIRSTLLNASVPVVHTLVKAILADLSRSVSVIRSVASNVVLPTVTSISVTVNRVVTAAVSTSPVVSIVKFIGTAGLGLLLRPVTRWTRRPRRR